MLVWDLVGKKQAAVNFDAQWQALASDGEAAFKAMGQFTLGGETAIAYLSEKLAPSQGHDLASIPRLLRDLESTTPEKRASAIQVLIDMGAAAQVHLFEALRSKMSLEVRGRVERILEAINEHPVSPKDLQQLRGIQVLERIGSPAAEKLLASLTAGNKAAVSTRAADGALLRLRARAKLEPVVVWTDEELREKTRAVAGSREPVELLTHSDRIWALAFSPDGQLLASAAKDNKIALHDVASAKELAAWDLAGGASALAFAADGKTLASGGGDRVIRLWDIEKRTERASLHGHEAHLSCLAFSPDGKYLAAGDHAGVLSLWDTSSNRRLFLGKSQNDRVTEIAFLPEGDALLVGGVVTDELVLIGQVVFKQPAPLQLWEVPAMKPGKKLSVRGSSFALAGAGRTIITGGLFHVLAKEHSGPTLIATNDGAFFQEFRHFWHDRKSDVELRMTPNCGNVLAAAGHFLLSGPGDPRMDTTVRGANTFGSNAVADSALRLWDTLTGQEIINLPAAGLTSVAFSPDRHTLAWGDDKGRIVLRNLRPAGPAPDKAMNLDQLWTELAGDDAKAAWQAQWRLAGRPDKALPFLRQRLQASAEVKIDVARLLEELNSPNFKVREAASQRLVQLGTGVESVLEEALAKNPPAEMQRRLDAILKNVRSRPLTAEELRESRIVQALAWMECADAKTFLAQFAEGPAHSRLTREARRLGLR